MSVGILGDEAVGALGSNGIPDAAVAVHGEEYDLSLESVFAESLEEVDAIFAFQMKVEEYDIGFTGDDFSEGVFLAGAGADESETGLG